MPSAGDAPAGASLGGQTGPSHHVCAVPDPLLSRRPTHTCRPVTEQEAHHAVQWAGEGLAMARRVTSRRWRCCSSHAPSASPQAPASCCSTTLSMPYATWHGRWACCAPDALAPACNTGRRVWFCKAEEVGVPGAWRLPNLACRTRRWRRPTGAGGPGSCR